MPRSLRPFLIALTLLLGGLFLSSSAVLAAPQINNQINYQARLMDSSGFPVADGNYSVYLSLYDASTAGTRLWTATGTLATPTPLTVNVQNGLFTVLLGDTSAAGGSQNTLDTVNWNSDQLYLGVTINADAEMSPRKRFASAPQAFNARQLQGMYASSTASGGQTLFTLNQTQNDAATGTRSTLDVRSNGTSNSNDFLIRGINDANAVVFSINRQGSVTSTNVFVSGLTSSTNLNANIASFATATVAGQGICLSNGLFCSTGSVAEADTLQTVSNRGSFTTTTLTLFGGLTASNITATGTLNVTGVSTLAGVTFTNATATSVTSTNVFGVNGAFTNLTVDSLGVVGITWTNATGTNTTSTNLFASNLLFSNAAGGTLLATTVSTTNLTVTGQLVCLADGTNCPSGTSPNLQTVTNAGNTTTNAIQFAGGTSTGSFVFNATATVSGTLVSLSVTTTDLFANNAFFATATVSGQAVCLANGVGCPIGTVLNDTLQSVTARGSFTTTTAQFFGGFVAASSSVTGTLNVAGSANLLQNAYVGTSTYSGGLNSLFAADGNDLFVAGSIGSVSSIYTNGSFVAGSSSTIYADGSITKTNGILEIQAFSSLTGDYGDLGLRAGDGIVGLEDGGAAFMTAGDGASGGDGGWAQVFAGNSGTSSGDLAGTAALVGGSGVGLGDGGDVLLQSGGANNGVAGDIQLNAGSDSTGFDQSGSIYLRPGISSAASSLNDAATFVMIQDANNTDITAQLRFGELAGSNDDFVGFRAANTLASSTIWILPQFTGASGTVIATDGNNQLYFSSVCLTDGTNCPASSGLDTLQSVTARGSFTTTTAQFFGGFVAASSSVTGTFVVVGSTSLRNVDFTTATGTSVTTTNLFATLGGFTTATATNANINILSAATGTVSNLNFRNATGTFLFASTGTFATVTSSFLYANTANFATATVSGVGICLSNGVGCPASGSSNDTLQSVTARGSFTTTTAQFFGGFVAASSSVTGTFAVAGTSTLLRDVYVGTSTYDVFLNSDFVLDGNDLFAADNIGSVSSIFSNGMLVLGETGPTLFGDGFVNQLNGTLDISTADNPTLKPSISITAGDGISAPGGDVSIRAGDAVTPGPPAGNIFLTPGDTMFGNPGHLHLNPVSGSSNTPQFRFTSIGGGYISLESPSTSNSVNYVLPFASGASSTVIGTNGSGVLTFVSVCLTDGTNCPASSGLDTLQSATARGSFTTTTAQFFGGFVAASSSVTGTLNVAGKFNVTGTVNILLTATSTPFYINSPRPSDSELAQLLAMPTTGTEGFLFGNYNIFGSVNASFLDFSKDLSNSVTAPGGRISYYNEFNQMSFGVNASGSSATVLELTDNDAMLNGFGAEAAMTIRKYTDTRTSSMIHLWNLGSNSGEVTVNVGSSHPNSDVFAQIGSIYFRQNSTASGTQAYLNRGATSSWFGIATVDMLPSSSTFTETRTFLANRTTSTLSAPSNFTATIAYSSGTTFGGLCIDDTFSGTACPTTGINGASIMADGPILANAFDIAEFYSVTGTAEAGDVLVLHTSSTATVERSSGVAYDSKVIGIVSTAPGFVLGWSGGTRVALAGRVPVKVSMNNGSIQIGDALVSSDVPGYAMKATKPGMILGYAIEDASTTGTTEVFVSVGFWAGLAFGPDGSIQVDDNGNVSIMNDLHVGGRLFPSLKGGGIQDQWYLFVNTDDPTSTYISTNADGWMSMDSYDFAERYYSPDKLEPGDVVIVSNSGNMHVQRSLNEDDMLLGIVSTRPAFIAGRPATSTYPIALSGRVPTKVSPMNGAIKAGDPLAPTSIPGVVAKAVRSGPIVGLALEDFDRAEISKIEVFVNPTYWVNEQEVAEQEDPEVSSEIVVSQGKQGFATISAGAKKVRIEFPTLNAYPNVQVTPRGSTGGAWWTDDYSDSGFEIIMQETQDHDVVFAWRVEATAGGDVMRMSDGTYAPVDPLTGMPTNWVTTGTDPIVDEIDEPMSDSPEEVPELEEEFISEGEVPAVGATSTETP